MNAICMMMNAMMDAIMETTFFPKPPHVYSDPYLRTISMSARVRVASLHMKSISTKEIYWRGWLVVRHVTFF